ncbi:MAG TPA: RNA polymerase factor sigma-32 [Candidatus Binataceae bacterium]|nr:RNA polymerase factor sigma-32 [Candidatus Binataceae bacterium]
MARKASKPRQPRRRAAVAEAVIAGADAAAKNRSEDLSENLGEVPAEDLDEGLAAEPAVDDEPVIEVSDFHPLELDDSAARDADGGGAPERVAKDDAGGALVTVDPLSRYLADVRRFPLLTREEETAIAKRYTRDHDPADAYRLVTANLRLVVKIAFEFARASKNVLDLIQEGNVGLMEAVKNFDPYRGIRFPSYAVWWVRAYIYRYLINNWRLVKIGTTQAQRKLFFNLRKETERLEAQGFAAQPKLLAQRMGVKESEVREMQERMAQSEVSLDQPTAAGEDTRLIDVLPDRENNPEEAAAEDEWRDFAHERVKDFEATLRDKEREIFRARLLAENPDTLQEIGARFGISRERVRQIETRLKKRLKEFIQAKASDIGDSGPN